MKQRCKVYLLLFVCVLTCVAVAQDPLPSWNDGPAKQTILNFVKTTTDSSSSNFVPAEQRIVAFDQDGTTWVEQPMYAQLVFALERVVALAPKHPEWKTTPPFQAVLTGDKAATAKFTMKDLETILMATHTGMSVDEFQRTVKEWMGKANEKRWGKHYNELVYQPMLEVMQYFRANGYKTYIVTGGGQEFVRAYAQEVYEVPPEQVIGSALETQYTYDSKGDAVLMRPPKLLVNNDHAGKPKIFISSPVVTRRLRSAIRLAISKCWNIRRQAAGRPLWCLFSTTTRSANLPTDRHKGFRTQRSGPSPRRFTTKRRRKGGRSSA